MSDPRASLSPATPPPPAPAAASLVTQAEREWATQVVAAAYGDGRLSLEQHEHRVGLALGAQTVPDLDVALSGLGVTVRAITPPRSLVVRKVVFAAAMVPVAPYLTAAMLLMLLGGSWGMLVAGLTMAVLVAPGAWALWRWAWPPSPAAPRAAAVIAPPGPRSPR